MSLVCTWSPTHPACLRYSRYLCGRVICHCILTREVHFQSGWPCPLNSSPSARISRRCILFSSPTSWQDSPCRQKCLSLQISFLSPHAYCNISSFDPLAMKHSTSERGLSVLPSVLLCALSAIRSTFWSESDQRRRNAEAYGQSGQLPRGALGGGAPSSLKQVRS